MRWKCAKWTVLRWHLQEQFLESRLLYFDSNSTFTRLMISQQWFRYWLGACSVPCHYLNKWWHKCLIFYDFHMSQWVNWVSPNYINSSWSIRVHCSPGSIHAANLEDVKVSRSLQCRHNERDGVSNHQPYDCFLSRLFRHRSKKTSQLNGEFPAQRASNAENGSIWWRHHGS